MLTFKSLKDFITLLNREKDILTSLFEKRSISIDYETVVNAFSKDGDSRIEKLIAFGILIKSGDCVEIDEKVLDFFESFLAASQEVNTATVNENLESLKNNISYYLAETSESGRAPYLKKIKRKLRNIKSTLSGNIVLLFQNVENVYKTERNQEVKRLKLENYREKRNAIAHFIDEIEKLLREDLFFTTVSDPFLDEIVVNLRFSLIRSRENLLEVQHQIISYLLNIRHQTAFFEKIQKLKALKDAHEIKQKTDIVKVVTFENSMMFQTSLKLFTNIDPYYLGYPQTLIVLEKILKERKLKAHEKIYAENIDATYFSESETFRFVPDYKKIKEDFRASGKELFSFVLDYDFGVDEEINIEERISAYFKIFRNYYDELVISDDYGQYDPLSIEYLKIYYNRGES